MTRRAVEDEEVLEHPEQEGIAQFEPQLLADLPTKGIDGALPELHGAAERSGKSLRLHP